MIVAFNRSSGRRYRWQYRMVACDVPVDIDPISSFDEAVK
jgi:hypothetical protein